MAPVAVLMTLHYFVTYELAQKAKGFVPDKHFMPDATLTYWSNL